MFQHLTRAAVLIVIGASSLVAQRQALSGERTVSAPLPATAVRATPTPPRIDGVLDDRAWRDAPAFDDFRQRDPDEGQPVTERTHFAVVYSDDALYVGVRAYDSHADEIVGVLTRRDGESPSDEITIAIDSYLDRRTGFAFSVNAAGVKRDVYLFNDNQEDPRWDAVWDAAVSVDSEGWTAEFMIPFSQLRFTAQDRQTFGFNVERRISRLNEIQQWRVLPKSASGVVSLFGDLIGLDRIQAPRRLEVMPYTVVKDERLTVEPGNPFRDGPSQTATVGADLKYGLTSALTLTATINPDFGQVEADPAVVNLSAFETFFPERRPFFSEGLDIFSFRIADGDGDGSQESLFYTRRIGRTPQGGVEAPAGAFAQQPPQTTILAAAKLSGKTPDGWTIGVMSALTDEERAQVVGGSSEPASFAVEPRSGYAVARIARDLRGGQTVIGGFATTVQRDLPDRMQFLASEAYTGGLNWAHRFRDDTYSFNGRLVASLVRGTPEAIAAVQQAPARYFQRPDAEYVEFDPERTALSGHQIAMNFGKHGGGNWRWSVGFDRRSPGLEVNDIGFQRSADQAMSWIWVNRRWLQPGRVFRRFNLNANVWSMWNYRFHRRALGGNLNGQFTLRNYWSAFWGVNRNFGGVSQTALRGGPAMKVPARVNGWWGVMSDRRKSLRIGLNGFFSLQDDNESVTNSTGVSVSWRPSTSVDLRISPRYAINRNQWQYLRSVDLDDRREFLFGDLDQKTVSTQFRGDITFSPTLSLQLYAEPFVSSGQYGDVRRVVDPGRERFAERFAIVDAPPAQDGTRSVDLNHDGVTDANLGQPDFTFLSFRSNAVLRWEYMLGSTLFVVWQHGRNGFENQGAFNLGRGLDDLFAQNAENVFLIKVNYWLSP